MYDPFEIPSLEQIEEMERQQSQAIEALEYVVSDAGNQAVKCQRCGKAVPIVGKLSRSKNDTCKRGKDIWRIIRTFVK